MRNFIVAALVAVGVITFVQAPALAGCQNGGTYLRSGECVQKRVIGYRTVTVRKPVYRTVRTQCATPNCAPVAVAPVTVQTPSPRIVEVPQQVIVRPVPQVTYLPAPQVSIAPAPCQAPVVAPPVTRAPCGTCGQSAQFAAVPGAALGAPGGGYVAGAPRSPGECIARGGTDTGRGCQGYR